MLLNTLCKVAELCLKWHKARTRMLRKKHLPKLARHTDKPAIIRSISRDDGFHGRGMYWNLTGHKPPRMANIAPMPDDRPSITAVISKFRASPRGVPNAIRMP